MDSNRSPRAVYSWAAYDWANSAFATTVMAGLFPLFFKEYWSEGADVTQSTFQLGVGNSIAGLIVAIMAPALGAIADRGGAKKKFLFFFAFLGVMATTGLFMVAEGHWMLAIVVYIFGVIGFSGGNAFYDSLIVSISDDKNADRISSFGFAVGYLGGAVLFTFNVLAVIKWEALGFSTRAAAVQYSFLSVAVWWALFSIPIFLFVKEPEAKMRESGFAMVRAGFAQLAGTFRAVRHYRVVATFIVAFWFYMDGVHTVIRMAVDYGTSLGFDTNSLIAALLITQFVGFPATLVFGRLGERFGAKRSIMVGIGAYSLICVGGYFMTETYHFYFLAGSIGLVQGAVQALSRSLYMRIIPKDKAAEFFGFYNMMGKFAAVIGPVLMGTVGLLTGEPRYSILSLIILFAAGGFLLSRVDVDEGIRMARES